ncbi:fecCD transport family protein [Clostridium argentinense CDC 2741]|uniref:FecCD transport family protein n=1 Tax=Clostridium argentinense CDC 2741 TaxID=1418104 RepID=A0A0C1U7U2_9CLOT|nr:iron ABC transporter permease [Clostridium argentinense]ARC86145.1 iron ABC transporter permease [Clostridium argentinense]KIE47843.1 fecCD transport family protein [Clostridium argentinense CDC 2741]NFF40343.1 iron ABC transporter permease [Clostridium argentinense]NFP50150.1 iron ABC transporter permease [Clostridium argentinense]NFP72665.1 iron ABC transporter permease [Clostridium argentinense]
MTEQQKKNELYKRKRATRQGIIISTCFLLLLISFIISMNTGYMNLSPKDTLRTFLGNGTAKESLILFDLRLPRIIISMLVGVGLSISGCIIQGVSRNPLADPGLLGINAGAGLMVIMFTMLFGAKSFSTIFTLPFLALIGAGLTAVLIYLLSYKKEDGITPMRLILTGIAVQAGIAALTTVLVVKLDDTQFNLVATWQAGSIWGSNWKFVMSLLPWLLFLIPYAIYKSRVLDILNFGDDIACGLGTSVEKERRKLLAVSVMLAASCVSISGNISFVGLLAPHLARRLVGPKHIVLIPTCGLIGAVLVSISDTIARVIMQSTEIPTGIVVAIIGAPYFLYLLSKEK